MMYSNRVRQPLAVAAMLLLAGCATASERTASRASSAKCDANAALRLVGQPAEKNAAAAQKLSGARLVRRYKTGDMLTMDFRPDRLNIETDPAGLIVKLSCG